MLPPEFHGERSLGNFARNSGQGNGAEGLEKAGNQALLGLQVTRQRSCRGKVHRVHACCREHEVPHDADFYQGLPQLPASCKRPRQARRSKFAAATPRTAADKSQVRIQQPFLRLDPLVHPREHNAKPQPADRPASAWRLSPPRRSAAKRSPPNHLRQPGTRLPHLHSIGGMTDI